MNYTQFKRKYPEANITEEQYKELAKLQNEIEKTHINKKTKDEMTKQNVAMLEMATNITNKNLKGTK